MKVFLEALMGAEADSACGAGYGECSYMSAESIAAAMRPPLTAIEITAEEGVPALMAG